MKELTFLRQLFIDNHKPFEVWTKPTRMATGGSPLSSLAAAPPAGSTTTTTSAFSDHSVSPSGLTDSRFRQCFNEMRESGEMCDVQIVVEDSSFAAHKLILAGCSPYFRGMFRQGNFDESKSNRIPIDPKVCI